MPFITFLPKEFETTHERETFGNLIRAARLHWDKSDETLIIVGNASLGSLSPDAIVLKHDAIIALDFKKFSGRITGSEAGEWYADAVEVKGRKRGENPFQQIRDYKIALQRSIRHRFGDPVATDVSSKKSQNRRVFTYLDHIAGIVVFRGPIQNATTLEANTKTWFKITDESDAVATIARCTSNLTRLPDTRLHELAYVLAGTHIEYTLPGEPLRAPAGPTYSAVPGNAHPAIANKLAEIRHFVGSEEQLLILKGMVGTGIGELLDELTAWLDEVGKTWLAMAPSRRIASSYEFKVDSIYSAIYKKARIQKDEVRIYDICNNEHPLDHIYIVCESHLVSNSFYETEVLRYGTGRLLADLLSFVDLPTSQRKIIFVGDPFSLTRGKAAETALSEEFVRSLTELPVNTVSTEALLPGSEGDPILRNCLSVASCLERGSFATLRIEHDDTRRITLFATTDAAAETIKARFLRDPVSVKYIAYSNASVQRFNLWIRNEVFGRVGAPKSGDIVEFYSSTQLVEVDATGSLELSFVSAGTYAEVVEAIEEFSAVTQQLSGRSEPVTIRFSRMNLRLLPSQRVVTVLAFRDFVLDERPDLPRDHMLALKVAAKAKARRIQGVENESQSLASNPSLPDYLELDPHLNAAQLRFGYALTAHHSLGRRFESVIANCDAVQGRDSDEYFRFVYSLLCSAVDDLVAISPPDMDILTGASWITSHSRCDANWKPVFESAIEVEEGSLRGFYFAIKGQLEGFGMKIGYIEHHNYQEHYHVLSDVGAAKIQLFYNKKGRVTRVGPLIYTSDTVLERLRGALSSLVKT